MKIGISILLFCIIFYLAGAQLDPSSPAYTPRANGEDIVSDISDDLNMIFPNDHGIMKRTACVESTYGLDNKTYRPNSGGIWQVDKEGFDGTQDVSSHPQLSNKFAKIMQYYNINWRDVTYDQLMKPIISGIAARLYYSNIAEPIPTDVKAQATYWKKYYNTNKGAGDECRFLSCPGDKKRLLESTCPCDCGKLANKI